MTDPVPASAGHLAERAAEFTWDGHELEPGIGLALSGGGFRAMLFHAGALMRLNEFGLLAKINRVSSVSGGSIAAGCLACIWQKLGPADARSKSYANFKEKYVEQILGFSRERIDLVDILTGLLPWTSAAEQVAASYDKSLFRGATLQTIPDIPQFVFCATNMQTGVNFRLTKAYAGDYIVGRVTRPNLLLSRAVAASSAFPPFLSPLVLELPAGSFTDWPGQQAGAGRIIDPAPLRARVLLTDGGVYDNLGLEPIVKRYMTVLVSDGGAPFVRTAEVATDPIRQLQHIFDVTDNQVRSLRRRDLISRYKASSNISPGTTDQVARFGTYWGIDTDPAKAAPAGALPCTAERTYQLASLPTRLSDLGELQSKQLINWGYTICDRCVRVHYTGPEIAQQPAPQWPYPEAPLD